MSLSRITEGLRVGVLVLLAAFVVLGVVMFRNAQTAAQDAQRQRDLDTIKASLATAPPAPALPAGLPSDPDNKRYQYRSDGTNFVACATLERFGQRRAYFATRTGTFRADARYCDPLIEPAIATLVTDTGMTDRSIPVFLESQPRIADKETIKRECSGSGEKVAVYGCYDEEGKIWILQVTDPGLAGLTTVAAIHELLHAVQLRTPPDYALLEAQARKLNDPLLNEELSLYTPEERVSELHTRLGTEYATLDPPVEAVYTPLFDRAAVSARYQPYASLLREIQSLKTQIGTRRARLDQLERQGNVAAYNAQVDPYNELVRRYNRLADRYNLITE